MEAKKSTSYIKKLTLIATTALVMSVVLIVASNTIFKQGFTFNRWGKVILVARILEDGPGLKYLNSVCTVQDLKPAQYFHFLMKHLKERGN